MRIEPYFPGPADFRAYDPEAGEIARALGDAIRDVEPILQVEHIGSTSIPGCGGKGIIDLMVLYPEGHLSRARTVLDLLGFQKQGGPEPFPEERPMRVGSILSGNGRFRIHAHVIALQSEEHRELVRFREVLRGCNELRQRYEERKRAILASGIQDPIEYCKAKEGVIQEVLKSQMTNSKCSMPNTQ